jgi:hypothetical protein
MYEIAPYLTRTGGSVPAASPAAKAPGIGDEAVHDNSAVVIGQHYTLARGRPARIHQGRYSQRRTRKQ